LGLAKSSFFLRRVKNFTSKCTRSAMLGYRRHAITINDPLKKNPPIIKSRLTGYTYLITVSYSRGEEQTIG
jgi:hypothetical protein